jgi:hypothetical protein
LKTTAAVCSDASPPPSMEVRVMLFTVAEVAYLMVMGAA